MGNKVPLKVMMHPLDLPRNTPIKSATHNFICSHSPIHFMYHSHIFDLGSFVRGFGKFAIGSVELVQSVNLKFGVGQAIDNAVLNLIQNSVEAVTQEADSDTIMMNELRITQQYDRVKNIAARSVTISQELVEDSIQLLDRVVENVKKVE